MPMEMSTALAEPAVEVVPRGLTPIRAAVALSVFMFGMLAGADIAARVNPPVQDDGGTYLLHLLPSSWARWP